jgi:peptidoglycan/xylan/chitin deacetylase (PgdA/CDA1 family)
MQVALKVDVDTLRGTLEGVPALLRLFDRYQVRATFLFSLGPDHTGRALRRVFRPGFFSKVRRTSVTSHYGLKTLMYGTLLPGPDIGKRAGSVMRSVAGAGHEVGIHCYDHIKWQDFVANKDGDWTRREMACAQNAFHRVFGRPALVHGAAGWQLNAHTLVLEERMGFDYASDTRGKGAFYPILQGVRSACPQIPTTLPTLDELIGREGITEGNVHEQVYAESLHLLPQGQVYTLHAELEGMKLQSVMERLLTLWRGTSAKICAVEDVYRDLDLAALPCHQLEWGEIPGRSGRLALQGSPIVA